MKVPLSVLLFAATLAALALPAAGRKSSQGHGKSDAHRKPKSADTEAATQLQVFLDRANFSPGPIDGKYGEFTLKALALYRQSGNEQPPVSSSQSPSPSASPQPSPSPSPSPSRAKADTAPDTTGLDLASIGQTLITYTVTDADLKNIGPLPSEVPAKAKLKFLPYRNAAEAVAEKFHCEPRFLEQLNPGKTKTIKVGDQLKVPNVEPFELTAVKDLKPGSETNSPPTDQAANDMADEGDAGKENDKSAEQGQPAVSVTVDTGTNMLAVHEADKIIAVYPVTIGSGQTESPIGEWKVKGIAKLPKFRYDEQMLKHGERSGNFHMLPPGPNSPVGVIWIALNKKGIGLHGTDDPDNIGRATSHGCVRLTNWDVVRLAQKVKSGTPVSIH